MRDSSNVIAFGEHELDFERRELRRRGAPVELQPTPLRVLLYLAERRDRTVSRSELLEAIWPEVVVGDEALTTALAEARRAVGDDGAAQRVIRTQKGLGYRFVAEVEARDSAVRASAGASPVVASAPAAPPVGLVGSGRGGARCRGRRGGDVVARPNASEGGLAGALRLRRASRREPQPGGGRPRARRRPHRGDHTPAHGGPLPGRCPRVGRAVEGTCCGWRALGRRLDVSHLIGGSVQREGDRVRVTMQLVSTDTGRQVWSEAFEDSSGDRFGLLDRVTARVVFRVYTYLDEGLIALRGEPEFQTLIEPFAEARRLFLEYRWREHLETAGQLLEKTAGREALTPVVQCTR